jgi:drug/metabolite transporter (DMT)-like permease
MFLAGLPMVAPFGVDALVDSAPMLVGRDYALLAFLIAVPTVTAYSLVQTALRRAESSLVAAYVYLQPVFGVLLASFFLAERIGARHVLAATLIFIGVFVSTRRPREAPPGHNPHGPDLPSRGAGTPTTADR